MWERYRWSNWLQARLFNNSLNQVKSSTMIYRKRANKLQS
jgi:hypothetical protein